MCKEKAILFWSGGKDAALALYRILQDDKYEVVSLVTTLNKRFKRSSMHGVREELMDKQALRVGIPLHKMWVEEGTYDEYEDKLVALVEEYVAKGINKVIFGDIFLEDLKHYRDNLLEKAGAEGVYPLWKESTTELLNEVQVLGFKAVICACNSECMGEEAVGQLLSDKMVKNYPNVDSCGENGEFHTFVVDAPYFSTPLHYNIVEKVFKPISLSKISSKKMGFWYCDIVKR